jgi:hypothetical protein
MVIAEPNHTRPIMQARRGVLVIPISLCAELQEVSTHKEEILRRKVIVAKVIYRQWRDFGHRLFQGNRTRVVCLMGCDETGQLWQHFLPDEFMDKRIGECERYLLQASPDDEVITL